VNQRLIIQLLLGLFNAADHVVQQNDQKTSANVNPLLSGLAPMIINQLGTVFEQWESQYDREVQDVVNLIRAHPRLLQQLLEKINSLLSGNSC
jgi:hypothetical protein